MGEVTGHRKSPVNVVSSGWSHEFVCLKKKFVFLVSEFDKPDCTLLVFRTILNSLFYMQVQGLFGGSSCTGYSKMPSMVVASTTHLILKCSSRTCCSTLSKLCSQDR